jgi:hypothetical protein
MWIFSFMFGPIPFYDASDESLVSQMIRVVGYLPSDEWQEKWERMRLNFDRKLSTLEGELRSLPMSTACWHRPVSNAASALKGLTNFARRW